MVYEFEFKFCKLDSAKPESKLDSIIQGTLDLNCYEVAFLLKHFSVNLKRFLAQCKPEQGHSF
jgi:hypothetical protein